MTTNLPERSMAQGAGHDSPREKSPSPVDDTFETQQRLLSAEASDDTQYATYPPDRKSVAWAAYDMPQAPPTPELKDWVPVPLRKWFWVTLAILLVLLAMGLEVALRYTKRAQGWNIRGNFNDTGDAWHYLYTLPPVIVAAAIAAAAAWTDFEVKKMQPYIDLAHGNSPPHRSLLLDYTRQNNFIVWASAAHNRHYAVTLTTAMVLLSLALQPLAAALLTVRDVWLQGDENTVNRISSISLATDLTDSDLTPFLTAAGFASANVLYDLKEPSFIHDGYTIAPFELPTNPPNSTVTANTTAMKSSTNCRAVDVNRVHHVTDTVDEWLLSAELDGCSQNWQVDHRAVSLFGTDALNCTSGVAPQFAPVVFWFFTYQPSVAASATFCYPSFELLDVSVSVDHASGNITGVSELGEFTSSSNFSQFAGNMSSLNGTPFNGVVFNLTNPDSYVLERANATQLSLPAAVFQQASQREGGLQASFDNNDFTPSSDSVYSTYLQLIARSIYFVPDRQLMFVEVKSFKKRLFLSDIAVHLLTAALLLLAILAVTSHIIHRRDRRQLRLRHQPGTIASAVSLGAQTSIGTILADHTNASDKDIREALAGRRFRIHPTTMKIVMEGEDGYDTARTPQTGDLRRRSVFASFQERIRPMSASLRP
ncbi:hypothetical protein EV122DRAFT_281875 [Schizophyllum commune]